MILISLFYAFPRGYCSLISCIPLGSCFLIICFPLGALHPDCLHPFGVLDLFFSASFWGHYTLITHNYDFLIDGTR